MKLASPLLLIGLIACGPPPAIEDPTPPFIGTPLAVSESGGFKLELYTRGPLEVGRNEVAYRLVKTATAEVITRAALTQLPLMTMAEHSHRCPLTQPDQVADAEGRFNGTLIPTMPGGDMGKWTLDVDAVREGETAPATFAFGELAVVERAIPARKDLVVGEEKFIVTLNFTSGAPRVGSNEVIVTLHKVMEMGMSFAPQTAFTLHMVPEMPTMGHGSSGNVDPAHVANGEYRGTVNFNMAGAWRITFELQREGDVLGDVVYDFQL